MTQTKSIRIPASEWGDEPILAVGIGHHDGYFGSIDELEDYCEDEGVPLPDEVIPCDKRRIQIDPYDVLEWAVDNHFEDAMDHLVAVDELMAAINAWNEKQTAASWDPMYGRVVVLREPTGAPSTEEVSR